MHEDFLIYPLVKGGVARAAGAARWALAAVVLGSLAEIALSPFATPLAALSGLLAQVALAAAFLLLFLVGGWGHICLLAGQGIYLTRWSVPLLIFFSAVWVLCALWALVSAEPLLVNQAVLPLVLAVVGCCTVWLNLPRAAAAPRKLFIRLGVLPAVLLLVVVSDVPGPMLLLALPLKALALWLAWRPLRQLAAVAPRVVGLPPKE